MAHSSQRFHNRIDAELIDIDHNGDIDMPKSSQIGKAPTAMKAALPERPSIPTQRGGGVGWMFGKRA